MSIIVPCCPLFPIVAHRCPLLSIVAHCVMKNRKYRILLVLKIYTNLQVSWGELEVIFRNGSKEFAVRLSAGQHQVLYGAAIYKLLQGRYVPPCLGTFQLKCKLCWNENAQSELEVTTKS